MTKGNQKRAFSLKVIHVIHEARMGHGLRHKDFQLYRQYCTRRIHRLRKRFDLVQGERKFKKKAVNPTSIKDEKVLELPLLMAERCWAYAMQLKEESLVDTRKKFAFRNKLKKAAAHCVVFENIMENCGRCDARTQLEVQGYSAWLQGTVLFELAEWTRQWDTPVAFFNKALTIYSRLESAVTAEEAHVIRGLVSEMEVQLRYCRHHLGDESATSSLLALTDDSGLGDKLDQLVSQTKKKQASTLTEVTWKKRTMSVKNEKVRMFLLHESEHQNKTKAMSGPEKEAEIEKLLLKCKDAISIVKEDLSLDATFKVRQQQTTGHVSSTHFLFSYLSYLRLKLTVERNLVMAQNYSKMIAGEMEAPKGSKMPREQDVVRLYDLIIQNLNEMMQLAGLEEDLELKEENETEILFYRAMRCFHVAESYAKQEKYKEAQALCDLTVERVNHAKKILSADPRVETLSSLVTKCDTLSCTIKAQSAMSLSQSQLQSSPTHTNKKPLAERLEEYVEDPCLLNPSNPRVLQLPPPLTPLPCKPLFFDLALNHIKFPELDHKLSANEKKAEQKQKETQQQGGLSGLVKGLWGWGGKK